MGGLCNQHTGFKAKIEHLESDTSDQWDKLGAQDERINSIFTRINFILGGLVVMILSVLLHTLVLVWGGGG